MTNTLHTGGSLPPAFVPTTLDSAEMFSNGRMLMVTQHHLSGDLTLAFQNGRSYFSERISAAEARALMAELQRVAHPAKVGA